MLELVLVPSMMVTLLDLMTEQWSLCPFLVSVPAFVVPSLVDDEIAVDVAAVAVAVAVMVASPCCGHDFLETNVREDFFQHGMKWQTQWPPATNISSILWLS
jgi:hypothetical protein